ncbi:MAG TPA: zinc-binding dehydrogenase [Roseiarcus sp.]|nr:zinc-binding dehydrogenase [Roseiarcus sp.]
MKAAVLHAFGQKLALESLADPAPGPGEAVVEIAAARVLSYMREVVSGARGYAMDLPAVPGVGAVGRIRALGPDATRLKPGDWVLCDPTLRSRDDPLTPDIALQGLIARGPGGAILQQRYRNGSYAELMLAPLENLYPLGDVAPAEASRWLAVATMLVPYGGLLAVDFRPGEVLAVSGASGSFGGAAVMLGLALGAAGIVALGRNGEALAALERRFGARVRGVTLSGDAAADAERIRATAPGPVDVALDILPPGAAASATRAAALSLREFGRLALMGGQQEDIALPYSWLMRNSIAIRGQWMYPRRANQSLIALVRAGLVDAAAFEIAEFPLADVEAAIDHAAAHRGAFKTTALRPDHAAIAATP